MVVKPIKGVGISFFGVSIPITYCDNSYDASILTTIPTIFEPVRSISETLIYVIILKMLLNFDERALIKNA